MRQIQSLDEVWAKYRQDGDELAKAALLETYYPLVESIARAVSKTLPPHVELDDLIGDGVFGLIDAIERFDPDRGYKLETYAVSRIRGEMYDRLRAADWVPRALRIKAKKVEKAQQELDYELGRRPTDDEVAEKSGLTIEEVKEAISLVLAHSVLPMDTPMTGNDLENIVVSDTISDIHSDISTNYDAVEFMETLARAMKRMTSRERVVMVLYYCEALTLQRIGDMLDVTESRVCQIHNRALLNLRSMCIDLS